MTSRIQMVMAALMFTSTALASEPRRMIAADVAFDVESFNGTRVTVTDCILFQAQFDRASCPILTKSGMAGVFNISYGKAARALRERAVNSCTGMEPKVECLVEVTGTIRKSSISGVIGLDGATIVFPR